MIALQTLFYFDTYNFSFMNQIFWHLYFCQTYDIWIQANQTVPKIKHPMRKSYYSENFFLMDRLYNQTALIYCM